MALTIRGILCRGRRSDCRDFVEIRDGKVHFDILEQLDGSGLSLDTEVVAVFGDDELIIRTPAVAAQMQNDAELLAAAKAMANGDNNALRGKHVLWFTGGRKIHLEITKVQYCIIYCGDDHQISLTRLLDKNDIIVIADTEAEAEARLAAIQVAPNNSG